MDQSGAERQSGVAVFIAPLSDLPRSLLDRGGEQRVLGLEYLVQRLDQQGGVQILAQRRRRRECTRVVLGQYLVVTFADGGGSGLQEGRLGWGV